MSVEVRRSEGLPPGELLVPNWILRTRTTQLAKELAGSINPDNPPILLGMANGAIPFTLALQFALYDLGIDVECYYPKADSYGDDTVSSGLVTVRPGLSDFVGLTHDKDIFLVDDIADTRGTFHALLALLEGQNYKQPTTIALFEKPMEIAKYNVKIDHTAFHIPNFWVEGFGLDTQRMGRGNKDVIARYKSEEERQAITTYRTALLEQYADASVTPSVF